MKKILITGGCGFIGTALAQKLKSENYDVYLLDLKSKITNTHQKLFHPIALDIREEKNFEALGRQQFNCIFHLAAQTSGRISEEEPTLDIDTNIKGTLNLLRWMRKSDNNQIIFTSSMAVYGNSDEPINETFELHPLSNYGVSKVTCENYLKMYEQYGIKNTIFRLFNVYGRGQDMKNMKQGMVSIYIAQALRSDTIDVTGSVDRYRDFINVSDVIDALSMPLTKNTMWGNIYNIGTGKKTTVFELIQFISQVKGGGI